MMPSKNRHTQFRNNIVLIKADETLTIDFTWELKNKGLNSPFKLKKQEEYEVEKD